MELPNKSFWLAQWSGQQGAANKPVIICSNRNGRGSRTHCRAKRCGALKQVYVLCVTLPCLTNYHIRRQENSEEKVCRWISELSAKDVASAIATRTHSRTPRWVYIQARMTTGLKAILSECPWIVRKAIGKGYKKTLVNSEGTELSVPEKEVWMEHIPFENWTTLESQPDNFKLGQWVKVLCGPYRKDVSIVEDIDQDLVQVLVVPRMRKEIVGSKRKASAQSYPPRLLAASEVGGKAEIREDGFTYLGQDYVCGGLLRMTTDRINLGVHNIQLSCEVATEFQLSELDPKWKATMPLPIEWIFDIGQTVNIQKENEEGVVQEIFELEYGEKAASVELSSAEGMMLVRCRGLKKRFTIGDFVESLGGVTRGRVGWIELIQKDVAYIIAKHIDRGEGSMIEQVSVSLDQCFIGPLPMKRAYANCNRPVLRSACERSPFDKAQFPSWYQRSKEHGE